MSNATPRAVPHSGFRAQPNGNTARVTKPDRRWGVTGPAARDPLRRPGPSSCLGVAVGLIPLRLSFSPALAALPAVRPLLHLPHSPGAVRPDEHLPPPGVDVLLFPCDDTTRGHAASSISTRAAATASIAPCHVSHTPVSHPLRWPGRRTCQAHHWRRPLRLRSDHTRASSAVTPRPRTAGQGFPLGPEVARRRARSSARRSPRQSPSRQAPRRPGV